MGRWTLWAAGRTTKSGSQWRASPGTNHFRSDVSSVQSHILSKGNPFWWVLATLPLWVNSGKVGELVGGFWWQVWLV